MARGRSKTAFSDREGFLSKLNRNIGVPMEH